MTDEKKQLPDVTTQFRTRQAGHSRYFRAGFCFGVQPVSIQADATVLQRLRNDPHLIEVLDTAAVSPDADAVPRGSLGSADASRPVATASKAVAKVKR